MGEGHFARSLFGRKRLPVAREEGLLIERLEDETVIYDGETSAAHCLSPLAAFVFDRCDGRTSVDEMVIAASEGLGKPVSEANVMEALGELEDRELLTVPAGGFSRREMVKKSAVTAGGVAFAAPLITSIVAPAAVAAASATCDIVLCCPCCTGALGKTPCCTTPRTVNCQCVNASQGQRVGPDGTTIISGGKFCKTTGTNAPSDDDCINTINPPSNWATVCTPNVSGGAACGTCPS